MSKNLDFCRLESKSGVPIWYFPVPFAKSAAMGILVKVGTRDEKPEEAGIAHATEHILFQGTEEFPNSQILTSQIELAGGVLNAWTADEMTLYYNLVPAHEIERGFRVLSQMIRRPLLPAEKIVTEMQNIVQEIKRSNDEPASYLLEMFGETLYGSHPLGRQTLGSEKSVLGFTRESFRHFIGQFYQPANLTFIIAGKASPKKIVNAFDRYFPETAGPALNYRTPIFQAQPKTANLVMAREIEQAHLAFGALTTKASDRLIPALDMFRTMIFGGMSFPLFQEVRDKLGLCYEIWADNVVKSDLGCFVFYVGTDPRRAEEAFQAVLKVVGESKNSKQLLEKAKRLELGRLALENEGIGHILSRAASEIGRGADHPKSYQELVSEIESVTIEEVEGAVDTYLSPEKIVRAILVPKV